MSFFIAPVTQIGFNFIPMPYPDPCIVKVRRTNRPRITTAKATFIPVEESLLTTSPVISATNIAAPTVIAAKNAARNQFIPT